MYTSDDCQDNSCLRAIASVITPVNNEFLLAPIIDLEINYALFSMHPDKSLDPDGMNLAFFQRNWHIVGHEVISTHLSIISNSTMPIGLNDTLRPYP